MVAKPLFIHSNKDTGTYCTISQSLFLLSQHDWVVSSVHHRHLGPHGDTIVNVRVKYMSHTLCLRFAPTFGQPIIGPKISFALKDRRREPFVCNKLLPKYA